MSSFNQKMAGVVSTYTNNLTWNAACTDSSEWRSVTWGGPVGNKKFVAVTGISVTRPSRVAVSSDGYEWTTTVQPPQITFANQYNKIIYDNVHKRYFAAGTGNVSPGSNSLAFSNSTTGLVWTGLGKSVFSTAGWGIASNNKSLRLVAAGVGTNALSYSDTGTSGWTGVTGTSIFTQGNRTLWYGIKNLWVAVGQGANTIATSPDGVTWTGRGSSVFSTSGNCVGFNPTKAVAMGAGGNTIAYSINGTSWYGLGSSTFTTAGNSVAWTGTLWIGAGQGTNSLAYSYNGIVWFGLGTSIFSVAGRGFAVSPSMLTPYSMSLGLTDPSTVSPVFVAVGEGTNTLAYSNNGTVWFGLGDALFSTAAYDVAFNGIIFVAVGAGTNSIAWSITGINWTGLGTSVFTTAGYSVTWTGERWVAVGSGTNTVAWSTDGKVWTGLGTTVFGTLGKGISVKIPELVALGQGTNTVAYSSDGILFTGLNTLIGTTSTQLAAVANNGSTFSPVWVFGGTSGTDRLGYSVDGFTWIGLGTTVFSTSCLGLAYNIGTNNLWVAGGSGTNTLAWSPDGIVWTGLGLTTFTTSCSGVGYNTGLNNRWVTVGQGTNTIARSDTGKSWTSVATTTPFTSVGYGVAYGDALSQWVAVGNGSTAIAYSNNNAVSFTGVSTSSTLSVSGRGVAFSTGASGPIAVFTGKIDNGTATGAGTVLTVTSVTSGAVASSMRLTSTGDGGLITANTFITAVNTATFTGTIDNGAGLAGTTLTITMAGTGTVSAGMALTGPGIAAGTYITGGAGLSWTVNSSQLVTPAVAIVGTSYTVNNSQTITSSTMTAANVSSFLGSISTTTLTVSVLQTGSIQIGMGLIVGASTNTVVTGLVGTNTATFTGNISGSTLTVDSGSVTGTISIGMGVTGVGVSSNTIITAGSALSWTVNNSQTVAAGTAFTGSSTSYTINNSQTVSLGTQFYGSMARWVAVGQGAANSIVFSNDGVNWTGLGLVNLGTLAYGVTYSKELNIWVAVGSGSGSSIAYSPDSVTWTAINNSLIYLGTGYSVSWNGAYFLAGGASTSSSQVLCYSTNGINWFGYGGYHTTQGYTVAYSPNLNSWVSAGTGTCQACYSENGVNWMNCSSTTIGMTSAYGVTWGTDNVTATFIGSISITTLTAAFVTGTIVLGMGITGTNVGANTVINGFGSTLTATWTGTISGTTLTVDSGSVTGSIAVGMGVTGVGVAANTVITAGSALVWTVSVSQTVTPSVAMSGTSSTYTVSVSKNVSLTNMTAVMARWVLLGIPGSSSIAYSNDGFNWTASTSVFAGTNGGFAAVYALNRFVAVGRNSTTLTTIGYSTDGITWTSLLNSSNLFQTGRSIEYDSVNNRLIAGGTRALTLLGSAGYACAFNTGATTSAIFTGSITGTTLTVSSVVSGTIAIGMVVTGTSVAIGTVITAGSGTSWTVNISQTLTTRYMTGTVPSATFTGSISGTTLTTSSVTGTVSIGMGVFGVGVQPGTVIVSGTGPTYTINLSQTVSSVSMSVTKSLFVAGGGGGTNNLLYSPDGRNWTGLGTSLFATGSGGCLGVAYNVTGSTWIAVGAYSTATIANSINGITWTGVSTNTIFTTAYDVVYNTGTNTRWVVVGTGTHTLAYSDDSATWVGLGTGFFSSGGRGVAWSLDVGRFVAVGQSSQTGGNCIAYSSNGINWFAVPSSGSLFNSGVLSVAFGGAVGQRKFVAVGNVGTTNSVFAYSADGINWNAASGSNISSPVSSVFWSTTQNIWIAGGSVGTNNNAIAYSFDGIVWYSGGFTSVGGPFNKFAYGLNTFVGVGSGSQGNIGYAPEEASNATGDFRWVGVGWNTVALSDDLGLTWRGVSWSTTMDTCYSLVYNSSTSRWFAASANNTNVATVAYSDNGGNSWNNFINAFYGVKWVSRINKFVAVSHSNIRAPSVISTSVDGVDWTWDDTGSVNTLNLTTVYNSVADSGTATLVAGRGAQISNSINACYVYRLTSGTTWTRATLPFNISAIVYAPFPGVGTSCFVITWNNFIAQSFDDGLTWSTLRLFPDYMSIVNATWSPFLQRLCVISNSTTYPVSSVAVSDNGVTWTYATLSANFWGPLEWSPTFKVFCTLLADTNKNQQQCMISADGLNWYNSNTLNTNNTFNGIAWSDELGMFCGVGYQSTLRPYVFVSKLLT